MVAGSTARTGGKFRAGALGGVVLIIRSRVAAPGEAGEYDEDGNSVSED